jgi:hypothetical protein
MPHVTDRQGDRAKRGRQQETGDNERRKHQTGQAGRRPQTPGDNLLQPCERLRTSQAHVVVDATGHDGGQAVLDHHRHPGIHDDDLLRLGALEAGVHRVDPVPKPGHDIGGLLLHVEDLPQQGEEAQGGLHSGRSVRVLLLLRRPGRS